MVTKQSDKKKDKRESFVLAKKLMVTKHGHHMNFMRLCFVLAKKLMVTKLIQKIG